SEELPISDGVTYTMFMQDGQTVAGLGGQPPGSPFPSAWNNYINVHNIDEMPAKVTALGGTVIEQPFDIFDNGRMMLLQDPTGAMVCLWQAKNHIGSGLVNTPGAFTWNELLTHDVQKAEAFYTQLLGWTFQPGPIPGYRMCFVGDRVNGGIMQMPAAMGDTPAYWTVYFSVKSLDDVLTKVPAAGGKLLSPVMDTGVGHSVVAADPTGAAATYMQVTTPQPWDAV
ncbi:MAG: VOC family protein, partial [Armatimonadetes bacterium]|nr:VOC family protein [Anaerolineae bacterium]